MLFIRMFENTSCGGAGWEAFQKSWTFPPETSSNLGSHSSGRLQRRLLGTLWGSLQEPWKSPKSLETLFRKPERPSANSLKKPMPETWNTLFQKLERTFSRSLRRLSSRNFKCVISKVWKASFQHAGRFEYSSFITFFLEAKKQFVQNSERSSTLDLIDLLPEVLLPKSGSQALRNLGYLFPENSEIFFFEKMETCSQKSDRLSEVRGICYKKSGRFIFRSLGDSPLDVLEICSTKSARPFLGNFLSEMR